VPVALFAKSINQLLENDVIAIDDYKQDTIATYGLKYVAEENKTKSQYLFAVKTFEGKFIGILGVDYTKRKRTLSEQDLTDLKVVAALMGGILINHLKNK
jgi:GAF domain-containing protein